MSEPQPEYVWAHSEDKPKRGRVWLIVVLAVVAVAIAAVVFWLFLRPGAPLAQPTPTSSATPSSSPPATATAAPTPTATVSSSPEASPTPIDTPPPAPDPSIEAFRGQVGGWLDDALTGLDIVSDSSGQDALSVIDNLRGDAQRLAEASAPSSISADWRSGVSDYGDRLTDLRQAVSSGSGTSVEAARSAAQHLRDLVGI
ncbi:hypothetical protein ACFPJ2_00035 [Microbacterium suwonense]|uniref:Uncharacterized protein n=2 Tax=Microbacterium suwonense TaxID=683047 RepID=A0ABM8FTF0_9MICO|nr:hypothetical protein GCM10025863_13850 [Microbacterium suwonense]